MSNIHKKFWSMVIQPGENPTFTVERSFHISKAVIDFTSSHGTYGNLTSLVVDCDEQKGIILCNIMGNDTVQGYKKAEADLDIFFQVGQRVTFHSEKLQPERVRSYQALPRIHLSGYEFV